MKITVKLFAYLRELVDDINQLEIEMEEGSSVLQLLEEIFKLYDIRDKIFEKENDLLEWIAILKNGREIKFLSGLETILEPNDKISIFPPVVGG